jgi:transposase, IS30 family
MDSYIRKKLLDSRSPEIISAVIKEELWKTICWMTIRRYLETRYCYWIKAELLEQRFKKYYKRRNKIKKQWRLWDRPFIDQKPWGIEWEYEMDFVVSTEWDTTCMFNFVHKKSCMKLSVRLANRSSELVNRTVKEVIEKMKIKCIVTDNDISFVHRKDWWVPVYFTHPYHSREKWLIERVNRRYRVFYPKKTKLKNVSQSDLDRVTSLLNRRPMKRLWYRTPEQVFNEYITQI